MRHAARHLVALLVPRRLRLRIGFHPGLGAGNRLRGGRKFVHDAHGLCLLGGEAFALQDQRERSLHADEARQALGAAGAGQQADLGFRQAELQLRIIIRRNAVMAGERHFEAAAKGEAVQRHCYRFSAGLELAQRAIEREARVKLFLLQFVYGFLGLLGAACAVAHLAEVSAGAEAACLAGREHETLDGVIGGNFLGDRDDVSDGLARQRVHAAAGHVEDGVGNAIGINVKLESLEVHCVTPSVSG